MATDGEPILGSLYVYAPNKAAPIVFTVAYGLSAAGHIWQCYYHKAWKILGLHPLCALLFTAGYALREYGAYNHLYEHNNTTLIIFVVSQVLIYVCPPLLELSNYHVLGRILYYVPYFAPFPPGKVLSTFAGLMILVETLNALGVTLNANPSSSKTQQDMGSQLTVAVLALQLTVIVVFICLAGIFHRRCTRAKIRSRPVTTLLLTMYVSMILILVRCIYRLVEHTGGTSIDITDMEKLRSLSPILRYEYYFYIFESTLMLLNSVLWNVWHPGRFLPRNYLVHLAEDGSREIEEDFEDDRTLLKKTTHVLTFGVLFGKKIKHRRLHELSDYEVSSS